MTRIVIWLVGWFRCSTYHRSEKNSSPCHHTHRTYHETCRKGYWRAKHQFFWASSSISIRVPSLNRANPDQQCQWARCHPFPPQRSSPAKVSNFCSLFHISLDSKNAHRRKSGLEPVGWLFHGGVCSGFLVKLRWHGEPERSWSWRKWKWDLPSPMRSGSRWSALLSAGATSRPGRLR